MKKVSVREREDIKRRFEEKASNDKAQRDRDKPKRKLKPFQFLHRGQYLLLVFACFLTVISGLTQPIASILLGRIFDTLADITLKKFVSFDDYTRQIAVRTSSLVILGLCNFFIIWSLLWIWLILGEYQVSRIRELVFKKYLKKQFSWFDSNTQLQGDLTQLNRCIEEFRAGSSEALAFILKTLTTAISCICVAFYYSWSITLVILSSFPLIIILSSILNSLIHKFQKAENKENSKASELLNWILTGNMLIKSSNTQAKEYKKFINLISKSSLFFFKTNMVSSLQTGMLKILILSVFIQGFWFGNHIILTQHIQSGKVLVCLTSVLFFAESFNGIFQYLMFLSKTLVSYNKIMDFLELEDTLENLDITPVLHIESELFYEKISFTNVDFVYPCRKEVKVLSSLSATFLPKRINYLIGKSGSGKSTIGTLLLKFYDINSGNISIGGMPISNLSQELLLNNITMVQQEPVLFEATLEENIVLGIDTSSMDDNIKQRLIDQVIDAACLTNLIKRLPKGMNTKIMPFGDSLSGGEKQRVALARALLRNTPILILDEAFSALDFQTRVAAMKNVKKFRKGKTTIIISHSMEEIENEDLIFFVENGSLIEQGKRWELTEKPISKFKDFCDTTIENPFIEISENNSESNITYYKSNIKEREDISEEFDILDCDKLNVANTFEESESLEEARNGISGTFSKNIIQDEPEAGNDEKNDKIKSVFEILFYDSRDLRYLCLLIVGIICSALQAACTPIFSYFLAKVVIGIIPNGYIGSHSYNIKWSMVVFGVICADGLFTFLTSEILGYTSERWINSLKQKVFKKLLYENTEWYDNNVNKFAEISALLMNDTRDLRFLVNEYISLLVSISITLIIGLIWAIVTGWKLSLVGFAIAILFAFISMCYSGVLKVREDKYKSAVSILENKNYEVISSMKTVKCLQLDYHFMNIFKSNNSGIYIEGSKRAFASGAGIACGEFLTYIAQMILLYYGLKLVGQDEYSTEQLMSVYTLIIFTITSFSRSMSQLSDISRGQRAGTRLIKLLEVNNFNIENNGETKLVIGDAPSNNFILFKDLSFSYSDDSELILDNINLKISKGETVAIVGESGSGKSTLSLLLSRLYSVPENSLFINGEDITQLKVEELRRSISVVTQKAVLFKGTIYENLTYGLAEDKDFNQNDINEALKMVDMYNYVVSILPCGFDTIIGGDSSTSLVSGGQVQRLTIARAMIRKPKILIMDEATSALDPSNSKKICDFIQDTLIANNKRMITTILITHSQDVAKAASRVVKLDKGKIVRILYKGTSSI